MKAKLRHDQNQVVNATDSAKLVSVLVTKSI